jgi:type 1 fimbria pilin
MSNKRWFFAGVAALLFTMSACNNDDNDVEVYDMEPGTFTATITGDVETVFEGVAIFTEYQHQATGELFFTIGFGSSSEEAINLWFVRTGQFPGGGTYNIQQLNLEDMEHMNGFLIWLIL